jgi:hypothetical protein
MSMNAAVKHFFSVVVIGAVLVLPASETGTGQSPQHRRDGNWWNRQSENMKADYLVGFLDGTDLGYNFSHWGFSKQQEKAPCLGDVFISYEKYSHHYLNHVNVGQIFDGLKSFYADDRHRRILVFDAVWLVLNGIAGTPKNELNKMIENVRKNAID